MNTPFVIFAGAVASLLSTTAFAQTSVLADSAVDDRIENLSDDINNDLVRDDSPFGNSGRAIGFDGALALSGSATSGNTDNTSLGLGVDLGYYDGTNGYKLQLSYQYADTDGTVSDDSLLYDLEYTRDFNPSYFGFAKLQGSVDSFPLDTSDNFAGVGVGYRVYDTRDLQWTVSAGVGYRVSDLNTLDDLGEGAVSVSSDYFNRINDIVSFSMDTDVISSDADTVVFNDAGINVSLNETLAMRTSLVTEYHTDPDVGRDDVDNALGVSLVYNLN